MIYSKSGEFGGFENHKERDVWGKKQIAGIRRWKLDMMIQNLIEANILVQLPYDKEDGITRQYGYSAYFNYLILQSEIEVVKEDISPLQIATS